MLKTRLLTKGTNINNIGDNKDKDYKDEILKKIMKAHWMNKMGNKELLKQINRKRNILKP